MLAFGFRAFGGFWGFPTFVFFDLGPWDIGVNMLGPESAQGGDCISVGKWGLFQGLYH